MFLPLRSKLVKPAKFIVCIALAFSLYNTYSLRFKMSETEYQERFKVAKTVSTYIQANSSNSVLICENILLYQNICGDNFNVCDIRLYDKLDKNNQTDYYLLLSDLNYLKERYSLNIDLHDVSPVMYLEDGRYLYKYK